ncbi:hypothetical protein PR202_ga25899 [Eleusine coracana subsp. coracana]|uniref:RNase H type-1 domain-containing protein n=1 Tax=Eleusine coracana subsp. coracana TaxID=191504 RepID=A0AAV5DC91_ELECO|nr:hypothetical protein PR202_ga25899 [Eleusine coracana subsp. coracana]
MENGRSNAMPLLDEESTESDTPIPPRMVIEDDTPAELQRITGTTSLAKWADKHVGDTHIGKRKMLSMRRKEKGKKQKKTTKVKSVRSNDSTNSDNDSPTYQESDDSSSAPSSANSDDSGATSVPPSTTVHFTGTGSSGVIIRDSSGGFIAAAMRFIPYVTDAAMAEAWALKDGLELAQQIGSNRIIIQSDCMEVVQTIFDGCLKLRGMRRFFSFRSSTSNAGNGKAAPTNDARNENKVDEGGASNASRSPGTRSFRLSRQQGASKNEESSHQQLRRCLSFTSSAIDRSLDEQIMSFSHDIPCSMSTDSDAPDHVCEAVPARLTNLLNKNEELDLYIDGEQEAIRVNEKHQQKLPIRSKATYVGRGRPPRPHYAVPSSPKSCKEIVEDSNIDDVWNSQLAEKGAKGTCKVAPVCYKGSNDEGLFEASSENLSHFGECKSMTTVEDIYQDLQDVRPPCFYNTSLDPISSTISRFFASDACHHDGFRGVPDNNLEQDTDEKLLQRAKEVDAFLTIPPVENNELNALRDTRFNSTEMLQLIQSLTEDRKQLASELSSQIKARLTERFAAKEQYRRSKLEMETRIRRLEKEKTDIQSTLEKELDRRSHDWSVKLERFQSEEHRLRERLRELAEQNVSFQREITLLESNKVNVSNRITGLELQNEQLNDELQKVKNGHDNLQNSSVELHDNLNKAAEERAQIRKCLKDKEEDNKALCKVIARLQRLLNEQEKTITGLRQGFCTESDKAAAGSSDNRVQMELIRLTGVEQKLRTEIQSCTLEVESLRQENTTLLNRLQQSENRSSFSSICLDQELHTRVDILQTQGLSLLDDTSQLCAMLLEFIKSKSSENSGSVDAFAAIEYNLKYQSVKGRIENVKQSLHTVKSLLNEKQNEEKIGESASLLREESLSRDEFDIKLREEAIISRVLKERLLSRELDIEQLQSDLAASIRIQDVMQNEIQRVQDELCCLTHKSKHLEVQVLKKDEIITQIEQGYQESVKELTSLRCTLKNVSDERDVLWQESNQLRNTISALQNDVASLKQKIKSLSEDIQLKESEILLREGEISILRDSIDRPFGYACSPLSLKRFDRD